METFCSNTVALHLLLYCLHRASVLYYVEADGITWLKRGLLLGTQNV